MKLRNKLFYFFLIALTAFSFPLLAKEEAVKASDAVNVYVYNVDKPKSIKPLYIGDSIPEGVIIYLHDVKSKLTFTSKDGKAVTLDKPGFYDVAGKSVEVSEQTRNYVNRLVQYQSGEKQQADNLIKDAESDLLELQVDDPQSVPSPTT